MADSSPAPRQPSSAYREGEYQDPHWHDEEPEIQNDERPPPIRVAAPRRGAVRLPSPRRRFEDD
jgi:hypothetical protein